MRQADLQGISPRRTQGFTRRDPDADLADDLVQRDFTAPAPNRLWVTDLTMIPTHEGPLWLSAIRDAFSRRVVARETSAKADADLVLTVLEYALASREVAPGTLVHHADHGCRYTSVKLTTRPVRADTEASMGSVGDSFDNALAENPWSTIKTECIRGRVFATRRLLQPPPHPETPRPPQPDRVRGEALRRAGSGRTNLNTHQPQPAS
ncbi:transposase [Streptomyces sp. NPDC058572]|uniref:transposase n=1 Tax=Streptomyces sp. NPDC058572 TaxID=3346546 RepID=UPI003650F9FE